CPCGLSVADRLGLGDVDRLYGPHGCGGTPRQRARAGDGCGVDFGAVGRPRLHWHVGSLMEWIFPVSPIVTHAGTRPRTQRTPHRGYGAGYAGTQWLLAEATATEATLLRGLLLELALLRRGLLELALRGLLRGLLLELALLGLLRGTLLELALRGTLLLRGTRLVGLTGLEELTGLLDGARVRVTGLLGRQPARGHDGAASEHGLLVGDRVEDDRGGVARLGVGLMAHEADEEALTALDRTAGRADDAATEDAGLRGLDAGVLAGQDDVVAQNVVARAAD